MLGDDIAAVLPELRAHAESRMTATCTIERVAIGATDDDTLQPTKTSTTVWGGPCRIVRAQAQDAPADTADQIHIASEYVLHIPVGGTGGIRKQDLVTITASPDDADLVGRTFSVIAAAAYSQGTARRIPVREAQ
jgi:hypothetical protein